MVGLPFAYILHAWASQASHHVGYIEKIEHAQHDLPSSPEIKARLLVDLSQALIPSCYLPLYGNEVVWVYFRYEGVFKFCKKCETVGYCTFVLWDVQIQMKMLKEEAATESLLLNLKAKECYMAQSLKLSTLT